MDYPILEELFMRYPILGGCRADITAALVALTSRLLGGGTLHVAGNGGSHADAHHIAGELMKCFRQKRPLQAAWLEKLGDPTLAAKFEPGFPVRVLGATVGFTTAFANDVDAQLVFAQELAIAARPGDIFWGISTSGNAANVCMAARVARAKGIFVLALTGDKGGTLATLADCAIRVPAAETFAIQEFHLPIYHALCAQVEQCSR